MKLKQAVDYKLESITLYAPGFTGKFDLIPHLVELNYFEDIFNNTVSGNIVINDAVGIANFTSMSGTEYINIRFRKSDDLKVTVDRNFRVFGISDRRFDLSNNNEMYKIEFCSDEYLLSEQYRVSKSYKGKKVSEIIKDVVDNELKVNKKEKRNQNYFKSIEFCNFDNIHGTI